MRKLAGRQIDTFHERERWRGIVLPELRESFTVETVKSYLPAGPLPDGSVRENALIQFWTRDRGLRTIRLDEITRVY